MPVGRYTLRNHGDHLAVEISRENDRNRALLLVNGQKREAGETSRIGRLELGRGTPHHVRVAWWGLGRVLGCGLVEPPDPSARIRRERMVPLAPPEGTRAARWHAVRLRHPKLYASRHVVVEVGGLLLALFGVSVLLRSLLPSVPLGWLPDVELPDVEPPGWLSYLDPGRYVARAVRELADRLAWMPDLFGWLPDGPWPKYAIAIAVGVAVAVEEVKRRGKRQAEESSPTRREP